MTDSMVKAVHKLSIISRFA